MTYVTPDIFQKLAERVQQSDPRELESDPTVEVETLPETEDSAPTKLPDAPSRVTVENFFRHPDTHPLVLDLVLLQKYGPDFLLWEPETIELRVPKDFRTASISTLNLSKVQACKTLHLVDTYWERWEVFTWVTAALNGLFPDFESLQVPTVAECAIAVDIVNRIREDAEWSGEVKAFIAQVLRFEGVFLPPKPLSFVELDTEGYVVDMGEVRRLWPSVEASGTAPTEDTVTAEQLRRSLQIQEALNESKRILRSQLSLVEHVGT